MNRYVQGDLFPDDPLPDLERETLT